MDSTNGQQIINYLFFGQPGSGKTTQARMLEKILPNTMVIDGDDMRSLTNNANYGRQGRIDNITNATMIAKYLNSKKIGVIISVVAPYKELRDIIRRAIPGIILVHLWYDKNLLKRGREQFWVEDFEEPIHDEPRIDVNTIELDEKEVAKLILQSAQKIISNATTKSQV